MKVLILRELEHRNVLLGKTFLCCGQLIFFHESHKEEWFIDLNAPFGIDQDVANWLDEMEVKEVHHYVVDSDRLYTCTMDDLANFGISHDLGDITRIYLPASKWKIQDGLPYRRPWANHQVVFSAWDKGGGPNVLPTSPAPTITPSSNQTPRDTISHRAA
jgi:hypothetical protein